MLAVNWLYTRTAPEPVVSARFSASRTEVRDAKAGPCAQPTTRAERRRAGTPNGCGWPAQAGCQRVSCLGGRVLTDRPTGPDSAHGCCQPWWRILALLAPRTAGRGSRDLRRLWASSTRQRHTGRRHFHPSQSTGAGRAATCRIAASTAEPSRRAAQPTGRWTVPAPTWGLRSSISGIRICRRRHGRLGAPT